MLNKYYDEV